ncbi:carboxynorspermidine decarboxylase [Prevotella nigrescens]|uniref:carboxynorspermidine decarboxylase n=1 Tax=Prevotella nigrescens TaxID=28133 RepID=UPI001C5E52EF|nr:carboxynorspermidine decarboxylase [Prevotella nigrescens]MBW4726624.1 carboxynorspermidine decarboxylase [Prevotella nigrescens]
MKINTTTFEELHRPVYILEEAKLRNNLSLISSIAKEADIEIILAFKAYALWKTFPIFREYINATTASSLYEAKLGYHEFGAPTHTFSPAYTDYEIGEIARCSSHLVFNSLSQFNRFHLQSKQANSNISIGLRVNPEYSEVETLLYNPCAAGTRFGVSADKLPQQLPADIEGFHIHCHCENDSDVFERTLQHIEDKFSPWFKQIKWINFGGGHLMTRKGYDIKRLISILQEFKTRYPHLKVILEPGSAFAWQTGSLVSQVVDIVEDKGISTAILNVSFTCHMPDCLEMPYYPDVRTAKHVKDSEQHAKNVYRLGGNSCLSGDWMGYWQFDHELQVGENIIFEDMLHYTTVKTNMFNGITHPDIALLKQNGELETLRNFTYSDYKQRMD